jgi:fatty acid desaturase
VPVSKRALVVREARVLWRCYLAVSGISCFFSRDDALIYWILPVIAGQPVLRLFFLAEHTACEFSNHMFANVRTTYSNGLMSSLTWQMSYHAEHHAFPTVPLHALAEANARFQNALAVTAPGYLAAHRGLIRKTANAPHGER